MRSFFKGAELRHPGTPGNLAIEQKVAERFARSGFKHGQIKFEAPSFMPGKTSITVNTLGTIPVRPMHPTIFRPGNFKKKEFKTNLVYLGRGTIADLEALRGTKLDGAIALMEFDCGDQWQRFLRFGVRGFIFIGADRYSHWDAVKKVYITEVSVPRFFIAPEPGAKLRELLKRSKLSTEVRVRAEPSRWRNVFLRDLWVLIPGTDPDLANEVFVFVAPMDANCAVPGLAVGAQAGANLYLLIKLLDGFKQRPPARTVLLAAVNAHTQGHLGERMLAWHLLASAEEIAGVRSLLAAEMRTHNMLVEWYSKLDIPSRDKDTEELLIRMRKLEDRSTGKRITVKEPIVALARRDVNHLKARKLAIQRSQLPIEQQQKQLEKLDELYRKHVNVLILFNRVRPQAQLSDLSDEEVGILEQYVAEIVQRHRNWSELNRRDLEIDMANGAIREALAGRKVSMVVTLDLTWGTDRIGFTSHNTKLQPMDRWSYRFGFNTTAIAAGLTNDRPPSETNPFVDTMTNVGGLPEEHFFPARVSSIGHFQATESTPAVSLRNVYADAGLAFTPGDTFEQLNADRVVKFMDYLRVFFQAVLADKSITLSAELPSPEIKNPTWSIQIQAFKFDEFSASVLPQLPVPNSVILLLGVITDPDRDIIAPIINGDVVNCCFSLTDGRATRIFYCLDGSYPSSAFHFDQDFTSIDHAIDAGEVQEKVNSNIIKGKSQVLALFPCKEFPIYQRDDPSIVSIFPITAQYYLPLGGTRDAVPRKYGLSGITSITSKTAPQTLGPVAIFLERHEVLKLLTKYNRVAINASAEYPEGIGFSSSEQMGPDFFAAAVRDTSFLNHYRIKEMRGVTDQLAQEFLQRGDRERKVMEAARKNNDHVGYLRALYKALGSLTKSYKQITGITNDMLKAVVFYMALLLPFCFFVQKLLFKFVKIEAQMAAFAVFFVITFFVFRLIHPAFRVAEAPAAIFIAFIMGSLGLFVIHILHSRFEGEMQLLFRTFSAMDASEVGYSTVGQKAMLIGVNNMKRRRIRTALTTGTIVLVTFAMLAFSSVSKKLSPTIIPIADQAPYTGIFYQWPGSLRMDEASLQTFLDLYSGQADIVVRRWLIPPKTRANDIYPFHLGSSAGTSAQIEAALGLPVADNGFLTKMPILPGGRFFSSDYAQEAVLPAGVAKALKIDPDQVGKTELDFQGRKFTLVAIIDDDRFRAMKDLNTARTRRQSDS